MRIVVALGGNALLERNQTPNASTQIANVHSAAIQLAALAEHHELVITHGNGPQIGVLALQSANDERLTTPYPLEAATHLLLLPTDSLHAFFEQDRLIDNKVSFLATLNANTYTFDNISGLITAMSKADKSNANWNKVLLVPVTVVTTTRRTSSGGTETVITNIVHNMALTSTRLVRGTGSTDSPIKVSVIYSTFQ